MKKREAEVETKSVREEKLRKVAAGEEAGGGGGQSEFWVHMSELHSPLDELHLLERKKTGESDDLLMEDREVARHGRVYKKSNWLLIELQVLQTAKREDHDKQLKADSKEKHKSAAERWQWIEDYCWEHGVERSAQQCRDRWERMSADFKKVCVFEKLVPKGGISYWQMTIEDRKVKKLPSNFQQEVFLSLEEWFVRGRAVDAIDNVVETCVPSPQHVNNVSAVNNVCANFVSNSGDSSAGEGHSAPQNSARKKRKFQRTGSYDDNIAVAIEKANLATQRTLLECEDRKDRRHREKVEVNERIANGYMSALLSIADALRQFGGSGDGANL